MQYSFYCQKTLLCLRQINFLKYNTERMFLSIIGTVPDLILIVSNLDPILIRTLFYFLKILFQQPGIFQQPLLFLFLRLSVSHAH